MVVHTRRTGGDWSSRFSLGDYESVWHGPFPTEADAWQDAADRGDAWRREMEIARGGRWPDPMAGEERP